MTRLRLGKVGLNKYLHKINQSDTDLCRKCNTGAIEDIHHYILECQAYQIQRQKLITTLNRMNIPNITVNLLLGSSDNHPTVKSKISDILATYLTETKRFEE